MRRPLLALAAWLAGPVVVPASDRGSARAGREGDRAARILPVRGAGSRPWRSAAASHAFLGDGNVPSPGRKEGT
jgi:hypothetical protein